MKPTFYTLPLEAASECLTFTQLLIEQGKHATYPIPAQFTEELSAFISFMQVTVNAEIEPITIPDHHKRIYLSVVESFVLSKVLGIDLTRRTK